MAKKYKYQVLGGQYVDGNGVAHNLHETFTSEDPELIQKFKGAIGPPSVVTEAAPEVVEVDEDEAGAEDDTPAPKAKAKAKPAKEPAAAPKAAAKTKAAEEPQDMTSEFPEAEANDLRVVREGRKYFVFDGDDTEAANEDPLQKKQVSDFISEYLGDDEDDDED